MRTATAAVAIVLAAVLAIAALAAFNLHVFVDSHRGEVLSRAERGLARSLTVGAVMPSWWPVGIQLRDVVVGEDPRFGAAPFVEARAVRITVRLVPLVLGRMEVTGIVLDEPRIALIRDAGGRWNVASIGREDGDTGRASSGSAARNRRRSAQAPLGWLTGLTATSIRDGRVDIEDRGPSPRRLTMGAVRLRASELRFGGDVHVRLDAAMFPGSIRPDAHLTLDASHIGEYDLAQTPFDARLELADVDLGTVAALAGRREGWTGRLIRLAAGTTGTLEHLVADVEAGGEGGWRIGPHVTVPRVPLRARVRADVRRDGLRIEQAQGAVGTLEWTATGHATFAPWHAELALQSLPESAMTIALVEPPARLHDVALTFVAEDTVDMRAGHARVDDALVELTAHLASLDPLIGGGRAHASAFSGIFDLALDADSTTGVRMRADASRLDAAAIAARSRTAVEAPLTGMVSLTALASWPWDAPRPLRALSGSGTLILENGTIGGVNLVGGVLQRVPSARMVPQLLSAETRAGFPEVFAAPDTAVRMARLPFTVAAGAVSVTRMVVTADQYDIVGDGTLDPARQLRFSGDIVLTPALSTALRHDVPAMRYLAHKDGAVVIPFRVRGPLTAPRPEPDTKRLSARGIEALLDGAGARAPLAGARPPRANSLPDEDPRVQRLERMMRP